MHIYTKTCTLDTNNDIEKHDGCLKLWMKTVWKLRGVYSSLLVHSFDVLTDVLVILQWLDTPNEEGDHIDPQIMAYSAIAIMVFSKTFSAIAILVKDRDIFRSILQFVDLLIFYKFYYNLLLCVDYAVNVNCKCCFITT